MPPKKSPKSAVLSQALTEILAAIARPVTLSELSNVLMLLGHGPLEEFTRLSVSDLNALLKPLIDKGEVRLLDGGERLQAREWTSAELRALFARPEFAPLPEAIARALPIVGSRGRADGDNLQRDLRNAFYSANASLLNSVLLTLRDAFPKEYASTTRFDFLFDEPEEWLLSLPNNFLAVCAWRLLPSAMMTLRPVHRLAEKFYTLAESAPTMALTAMLDYALLCGDWKILPVLMRRLPQNRAPRKLRLAWIRFLTGRDDEAIVLFRDALDLIRQDAHANDRFFRTVGGLFGILSLLREGAISSLQIAQNYAKAAIADSSPHTQVYELLEQAVRAKANPDQPPLHPYWTADGCRLNSFFCCVAQYWLTGALEPAQRQLLETLTAAARDGGYNWLAEECEEFLRRLDNHGAQLKRWHDPAGKMPFLLDCVLTRNSWVDRLTKLQRSLAELPTRTPTRLAWSVNTEQAERGILTVKPIEQHITKAGKWNKGRRFAGYAKNDFRVIEMPTDPMLESVFTTDLTAQDKYACDMLRTAEDYLKAHPGEESRAWTRVLQALVGHPRLFKEGGDGQILHCVEAEPVIHVARVEDALQYSLLPEVEEGEQCCVRLERGDQICIYQFSQALQRMRAVLSGDFRIPNETSPENKQILSQMVRFFRIVSDEPLVALDLPAQPTNSMPCLQLTPREKGLHIEMMVRPFGNEMPFYQPGEGVRELVTQERDQLRRFVRNPDEELQRANDLIARCPRLAATPEETPWHWELEGLACYELTIQLRELLDKCNVQWPSDKKFVCRRTLSMGNISLHTQSYQSWFSVDGEVELEDSDATASLATLIQAVAERRHFVSLSDGEVVALSESLRKRLEELSYLGDLAKGRGEEGSRLALRVCPFLAPFLTQAISAFSNNADDALPDTSTDRIRKFDAAMTAKFRVPKELQATLRPYQEEGFLWLSRLDAAQAGACLADDMGLGKTVQAIALILAKSKEGPALIVAPTSVCPNWLAEFQKFAPNLECTVFGAGDREQSFRKMAPGHVMIASYGLLQSEQTSFRKVHWRIAVLDEAQAIKNAHAKRSQAALEIEADFRIVTTGTPVENNLSELWSIFNFTIPGLLGTREGFQHRFAAAIEHDGNQDATKSLRGIVSPFLLRRRKDQVLNDLPPKEEIDYPVELTAAERAFYDDLRKKILADLEAHEESDGQRHIRVLSGITKLRLAVDHPKLVAGGEALSGSKLEAFLELLRRILRGDHKVLVFSQFVKFLDIVRETLETEGIRFEYLDGSRTSKERADSVRNFQEGDVPVFLISLKAGGLGLNLTQADYVIHLDSWWNPAVENQASDRAHRLGQNKKVTIYHLQTVNTIEDKIKALHKRKRDLADNLLEDADNIETTSLEELLKLLKEN